MKAAKRLNDPPALRIHPDEPQIPTTKKPQQKDSTRWQTLNEFTDVTLRELSPRQVAVWLILFRDCRNGLTSTSQADIAKRAGLQRPTVSTTIRELEALGLVRTVVQGGMNRGMSKYAIRSLIQEG